MANKSMLEEHPDLLELRSRYDRAAETVPGRLLEGLMVLAGLYTAISPWVVGFNHFTDVAVTNLITGLILAVLAAGFAAAYGRTHNLAWVAPVLGAWTIVVPWVVEGSPVPVSLIISNVITGGIAVLLGIGMVAMPRAAR